MKHFKHRGDGYIAAGHFVLPFQMPKSPLGKSAALAGYEATTPSTFRRTIGRAQAVHGFWKGK